jgi:hypothetical protein
MSPGALLAPEPPVTRPAYPDALQEPMPSRTGIVGAHDGKFNRNRLSRSDTSAAIAAEPDSDPSRRIAGGERVDRGSFHHIHGLGSFVGRYASRFRIGVPGSEVPISAEALPAIGVAWRSRYRVIRPGSHVQLRSNAVFRHGPTVGSTTELRPIAGDSREAGPEQLTGSIENHDRQCCSHHR